MAFTLAVSVAVLRAGEATPPAAETMAPVVWRLDNLKQIGGQTPLIEGAPRIDRDRAGGPAVVFDGKKDGLVFAVNPLAGWSRFTIEILFSPSGDGPAEQRFLHAQDESGRRALLETRLNRSGGWWLDTFLRSGTLAGFTAIDPEKVHVTDRWYWAALRFDGKVMTSFVNGEKQVDGAVQFDAMGRGEISLGVRLNRVSWFKGAIREVRFHPTSLAPAALQRVRE
ncbi:MAG TPA: LamG-like jellyroll fold domain-containing protein [Opitutaceae bacterium]|nr:LamG-like jellyroll fold domain-containing protein [Opitutaceae bacterium]